jgi:GNAT superfamily N-acetyltransferase
MRRQDAVAVVRMVKRLAAYHGDATKLQAPFLLKHALGAQSLARVWVASTKNEVIGFALTCDRVNFVEAFSNSGLDLLFVEEKWRGRGIGQRLVAQVADDVVQRGCAQLHTSRDIKNTAAGRFYRSLGFSPRVRRPGQYLIEGKALRELSKKKKT